MNRREAASLLLTDQRRGDHRAASARAGCLKKAAKPTTDEEWKGGGPRSNERFFEGPLLRGAHLHQVTRYFGFRVEGGRRRANSDCLRRADSPPARVAAGRTGVRGKALIPSRARSRLYRPGQPATIIDLDPCPAAIDHPYMLAGQLDPLRLHYAADTWPGKSRPRATCPLK